MKVTEKQKRLYMRLIDLSGARECALNVVLVDMGLKDATTIVYSAQIKKLLVDHGLQCELDTSYLVNRVYRVIEMTSAVPVPGAEVVKRLYVAKGMFPQHLKDLRKGTHFRQGLLFGFPLCCILHYCRKAVYEKKTYLQVFQDFVAGIPSEGAVKQLDYRLMGGFVKYCNAIRVTEYIPCSHECAHSLSLVDRNLAVLEQLDKRFQESVVRDFNDTYLIYGEAWDAIGLVRGRDLKLNRDGSYSMKCLSSLPHAEWEGKTVTVSIVPHRSVVISCPSAPSIRESSKHSLPWSYCFVQPIDTRKPGPASR